ncbi:fumarylacetoacetase [Pseudomonas syringae pv. tagetis]|nr:fumarylacetoacetase [Pseudomonas syringae group genomosp. 7]KPY88148.1 Fumarylacetoacetase [Pseudomonas syringae pv. tagetis]RMR01447.1 Fumarylacetoacetase [Pseudomonas syringae pv. helianthi]RMW18871.1 Fumarylacetoacetase [Pseudomonas syringae pv. tagetis]UNB65074.1 fumarylacetoacetase [Pseudomonas syringae pv. helianthi]UNB66915.1 fumarylacetoacetase [Pseudomonas syringae pv. tagetis]
MTAHLNRHSWVASANNHPDFPLQNLPLGVFSHGETGPRGGVAIGDMIVDLLAATTARVFQGQAAEAAEVASRDQLNDFFALGASARQALRSALLQLLDADSPQRGSLQTVTGLLLPMSECTLHMPARVGDYSDFYVGIHHALNVGKLFRPDNPLLPNYKYVPIGYHGRASTLCTSGTPVRRPRGQTLAPGQEVPVFGPCKRLDYELELGVWIGPGNAQGDAIGIDRAAEHIAGFCLLNDWSARDIQAWEYQPLGPFLSKSFATTISPWVVTAEALAPFRCAQPARPEGDPQPLPYLLDQGDQQGGALDIELEVLLLTTTMKAQGLAPERLGLSNSLNMYWTVAQMVAHQSVNGCKLQPGDLLGTGTLSGPQEGQHGSLLEMTQGGRQPVTLANGEERMFLQSGDEVILRARCHRPGHVSIGFGECRGVVLD